VFQYACRVSIYIVLVDCTAFDGSRPEPRKKSSGLFYLATGLCEPQDRLPYHQGCKLFLVEFV
jgi:hypothetical protein